MQNLEKNGIPLNKGWSNDKKYIVDYHGSKALLRVSSISKQAHRLKMVETMDLLGKEGVPLCMPLSIDSNKDSIKIIFQWIDGVDLKDQLSTYPNLRQYELGVEAGRHLLKIHNAPIGDINLDWESVFTSKISRKSEAYNSSPLKYDDDSLYLDAITDYVYLLKDRPITFQHGDYHIGNMMISDENLFIIDFDRWDYGDPWEEFNRIVWSAQVSPLFASGIVDGYFEQGVPDEFWKLLLLYISSNMLSSLPWANDFGGSEVSTIINQHNDVVSWYQNHAYIPSWYNNRKTSNI